MARGRVIDRLIEIKTRQGGGSAFRPAREASMMRALVERHRGFLAARHRRGIWRVIISTFTYVQAPYSVHADVSGGDAAMRDSARFHFGFTTPCVPHFGAGEVIRAVGEFGWRSRHVRGRRGTRGWRLVDEACFAGRPENHRSAALRRAADHPAGMPVFVISKPLVDGTARDVVLEFVTLRPLAPGHPSCLAQYWSRSDWLRGQWDGACASCRAAGQDGAGRRERGSAIGRRRATFALPRSARTRIELTPRHCASARIEANRGRP